MKKIILISITALISILLFVYLASGILFYNFQEKIIFHPERMPQDFVYDFNAKGGYPNFSEAQEVNLTTIDNVKINGVLAKTSRAKGVVLYFHNYNAKLWNFGTEMVKYSEQGYDVMMIDYRGYGKSEGNIKSEQDIYNDAQAAYNWLKTKYTESQIIVAGREFGTAPAAKIAELNNPKQLILDRPFYSSDDFLFQVAPFIPSQALKYKFPINEMLPKIKAPIAIINSQKSLPIPSNSSQRLSKLFKQGDEYFPDSLEIDFSSSEIQKSNKSLEDFDIIWKAHEQKVNEIMSKVMK